MCKTFMSSFISTISVDSPKAALRHPQLLSLTLSLPRWRTPGTRHVLPLFCIEEGKH